MEPKFRIFETSDGKFEVQYQSSGFFKKTWKSYVNYRGTSKAFRFDDRESAIAIFLKELNLTL